MWKQVSKWMYRASNGWVAAGALALFVVFLVWVLPDQAAKAEEYAGTASSPDTSFYYTAEDLYRMAEAYGEEGRRAYVRTRFTFDVIWPLVYTLFLVAGISWLFQRVFAPGSLWRQLNVVPALGMLFDFLENTSASLVMLRYPSPTPVVDVLAPLFTMLKWVFVSASFVLLLVGLAVGLRQWVRGKNLRKSVSD